VCGSRVARLSHPSLAPATDDISGSTSATRIFLRIIGLGMWRLRIDQWYWRQFYLYIIWHLSKSNASSTTTGAILSMHSLP
jgi:hypothetical protein